MGKTNKFSQLYFRVMMKELITISGTAARIWDILGGNETGRLDESEPLFGATLVDASRILLIGESWASLWDWRERSKIATLPRHADGTMAAAFSPDGSRIATICGYVGIIWDGHGGEPILQLRGSVVESALHLALTVIVLRPSALVRPALEPRSGAHARAR